LVLLNDIKNEVVIGDFLNVIWGELMVDDVM